MTFKELIDIVTLDANVLGAELWTQKRLAEVCNKAILDVQVSNNLVIPALIASVSISSFNAETLSGRAFKSFPFTGMSDIVGTTPRFKSVEVTSDNISRLAREVYFDDILMLFNSAFTIPNARNPIYCIAENKVLVFPVPTAVKVYYNKKHPTLTADTDTILLPDEFINQVKMKAIQWITAANGDFNSSQNAQEDAKVNKNEIIEKTVTQRR